MDLTKYSDSTLIEMAFSVRDRHVHAAALNELERRGKAHQVNKPLVDAQLDLEEACDGRVARLKLGNMPLSAFCLLLCALMLAGCESSIDRLKQMGGVLENEAQTPATEAPAEVVPVPRDYWPARRCRACSNQQ